MPREKIRSIIEQRGMKYAAVARTAGMTPRQLCDMLHGRKTFDVKYVISLCRALSITPNELFGVDNNSFADRMKDSFANGGCGSALM